MTKKIELLNADFLQITLDDNKLSYGYNQEWYQDKWQRLAGCGPTTGTQMLSYVLQRDKLIDGKITQATALTMMEEFWHYATPGKGGLFRTSWLKRGLNQYFADKKLPYEADLIRILPFKILRPKLTKIGATIVDALANNAPIGFLNRQSGKEKNIDTWHWMIVVGIEILEDDYIITVYDESIIKEFSLKKWLSSSMLGGGFVYLK